ncbi:MAG: periplasmic heavy metal sensor [Acidobacteria bacterium]|nr:periplasmic heavy metal sensor [Acidobacteriota bacterium]
MSAKQKWTVLAVALLMTLGTAWAYVDETDELDKDQGPAMAGPRGPRPGPGMLREMLGLTDEQVSQLRALGFKAAKGGLEARTQLQLRRLELEELLQQDEPDRALLEQKIRALAEAQQALLRHRIEQRLAFRQVLTPEQRAKFRGLMAERMHHWRGFGRQHGGFGYGPGRGFRRGPGFGPPMEPTAPPPPPEE